MIHSYLSTHLFVKMLIFKGKCEIGTMQRKTLLYHDDVRDVDDLDVYICTY